MRHLYLAGYLLHIEVLLLEPLYREIKILYRDVRMIAKAVIFIIPYEEYGLVRHPRSPYEGAVATYRDVYAPVFHNREVIA